jgi:SulP family sulfate permease
VGAPAYRTAYLRGDLVAGFTVWGLLIPEMIAYAGLAGLPPQAGLYTLLASLVIYGAFRTCTPSLLSAKLGEEPDGCVGRRSAC